jgi:hemoglobin|tara:strand:+ start:66 stop:467 length:402 start_codon:yes stop_codon:yes gene_type:complete
MSEQEETLYDMLGERDGIMALANAFYDEMEKLEPVLTSHHDTDDDGNITNETRDRFGLFLVGWCGGPQDYMARFGHPRLRMRHMNVPIDTEMRDAWLRCMTAAMDAQGVDGLARDFLDQRFAQVADFLRNTPG